MRTCICIYEDADWILVAFFIIFNILFVRILALWPLLAYCASLG
jgi:hypothetical protein